MIIKLYKCSDSPIVVNKTLTDEKIITGTTKELLNIHNPSIVVAQDVSEYNYMYIPDFDHYYYINGCDIVKNGLYQIKEVRSDVLMTYKEQFVSLSAIIDKTNNIELADEYMNDGSFVTSNKTYNTIYNFPSGFNDDPDYILLTAGGIIT